MLTSEQEVQILLLNQKLSTYEEIFSHPIPRIIRSPEGLDIKEVRITLLQEWRRVHSLRIEKDVERNRVNRTPEGNYVYTTEGEKLGAEIDKLYEEERALNQQVIQFPWPLPFDEAGELIKLLLPILGKFNWYGTTSEESKVIGWMILEGKNQVTKESLKQAAITLIEAGIRKFYLEEDRLSIRIPKDCYPTSFYSSDDPEVWKKKNDTKAAKIEIQKKIKEVTKKLDRG